MLIERGQEWKSRKLQEKERKKEKPLQSFINLTLWQVKNVLYKLLD